MAGKAHEARGKAQAIVGKLKSKAGAKSGNRKLQAKGMSEQFKGNARVLVGKIKGATKKRG